jgi:competence protein ComEA
VDDPLLRPLPARPVAQRVRDWLVWFGIARLVVVGLSIAAVGAGGYWLLRAPAVPVESSLPRASDTSTTVAGVATTVLVVDSTDAVSTTLALTSMVVHVAGHVLVPGVYTLPPGARVVDAVQMAGGVSPTAQPDAINLAQPLHDGDRVYVPGVDDPSVVAPGVSPAQGGTPDAGSVSSGAPPGPIDLNSATAEQLDTLPGVGPSTAAAIVAHREQNGPFATVDDLDSVTGIGPTKLEALRPLVTV